MNIRMESMSFPASSHRKAELLLIVGGLALLAAILGVYFFWGGKDAEVAKEEVVVPAPIEEGMATSLGGEVYAKTQNPIADELSSQSATVENPIELLYKNPFD